MQMNGIVFLESKYRKIRAENDKLKEKAQQKWEHVKILKIGFIIGNNAFLESVRLLGFMIDDKLNFDCHISALAKK